jgi:hypothetical protein
MDPEADDTPQIDLSELRLGNIAYSIAVFPSVDKFVTAWRCPVCERRQGCWHSTKTQMEAVKCAEEEVLKHHAEYHQTPPSGGSV